MKFMDASGKLEPTDIEYFTTLKEEIKVHIFDIAYQTTLNVCFPVHILPHNPHKTKRHFL